MAQDRASSPGTIGWYLIARDGDLTARVHPGMHLGEDSLGEMSFQSSEALVEFDIEDGSLVLRVTADTHELEIAEGKGTREFRVGPQTQIQLHFLNNTVSIDTSFVATSPASDTVEIRVVRISDVESAEGSPDAASGTSVAKFLRPVSGEFDVTIEPGEAETSDAVASKPVDDVLPITFEDVEVRDILVPEVLPANSTPGAQQRKKESTTAVYSLSKNVSAVSSGVTRAAIFAAVVVALVVSTFFIVQPETETVTEAEIQLKIPAETETPAETEAPTETETLTEFEAPTETETLTEIEAHTTTDPPAAVAAEEQGITPSAPVETGASAPAESERPAENGESSSPELLEQIAALVDTEELPDEAAVDFVVQSLKTLHMAYPSDPNIRQSLEKLTERLAGEAQRSYDRGDAITAGRLIAQASFTGVAQESVSSALVYLAAAQAEAARRNEELAARAVDADSRTAEPDVARRETRDSAVDIEQAGQLEQVRAFRPAPSIYPEVAVTPQALGYFGDQASDYLEPGDAASMNVEELAANRLAETDASLDAEQPADLYPLAQLKLISQKLPPYPRRAPDGAEGSVDLQLTVTETGDVGGVEIIGEAPDYFTRPAMRAVLNWKFEPVFENGKPISVRTAVRVSFRQ